MTQRKNNKKGKSHEVEDVSECKKFEVDQLIEPYDCTKSNELHC